MRQISSEDVKLECDQCADSAIIRDQFTLKVEWLLDGNMLTYCKYGHYHYQERKPKSGIHSHSNFIKHPVYRVHHKTNKVHRRFNNFEEFLWWYEDYIE